MRIPITQTELIAMPNIAWRKFYDFLLDRDIEYTPVQKTAALCLRYYFGIQGSGHTGFFDHYYDISKDELAQALVTFNTPQFAENYLEAAESGLEDDYKKTDAWFFENANILLNAIEEFWRNNTDEFYEIVDENYTIRPPKDGFWAGAIIVAVVFAFGVIAAMTNPNPEDRLLFIPITIIGLMFAGLVLAMYAKRWSITVKKDLLTFHFLFQKRRAIRTDDTFEARKYSKGVIIYAHGRKLIKVSREAREFGMFWAQLSLAEKIVDEQKVNFSIRLPKTTIINSFIWPLISVGALIWTFQRDYNPASIYEKLFFSAAMLASLLYLARCLLWRVIITENTIAVKKAFSYGSEYQIPDITQVNIEKKRTVVLVNDRIALKITDACSGYHDLVSRLQSANIPFYRNGNRWRYETIPIEEQLLTLSNFGINPKHDDFIEWLCSEWETDVVRSDPYGLLMLLGGVRNRGGSYERLSDDVFYFDTGCVDDSGSYRTILERFIALSKGAFCIENLHSEVDHDNKKASISFEYKNTDNNWDLGYNDDGFDFGVIMKINRLLKNNGSKRFFYACHPPDEQGLIIIFNSEEMIEKLNSLTDFPFILHISETLAIDKLGMKRAQITNNFIVKQNRSNIKGSIFSIVVFGGFLVLMLFNGVIPINEGDKAQNIILYACLFTLTILSLAFLLHALRWKLMVSEDCLSIRNMIGREKPYSIKSITRVNLKTGSIVVCIGEKKIKVTINCENFHTLMALLDAEEIPFFYKNKLYENRGSMRQHRRRG